MRRDILYTFLFILVLSMASCVDDWFERTESPGEGQSTVSATVDFRPMASGLTQSTRAGGDAIKEIETLYVLLYDESGNLVENQSRQILDFEITDEKRVDADADNKISAETQTPRATFKLKEIPFGRYYIYAVANVPDLLAKKYSDYIKTIDGLKRIPLTWHNVSGEVGKNSQMLGYFTSTKKDQPENEPLTINRPSIYLHSWLRRAASKLTIAYDGSRLKEGVFVYLRSVQIKDIPMQCYLGKDNNVGAEGYGLDKTLLDGEELKYYKGSLPTAYDHEYNGPRITRGKPYYGSHHEDSVAVYFYENMQGEGKDKRQDADGKDGLDAPGMPGDPGYKFKDGMPYGTYVEVDAYYVSINSERIGNGSIKYRFMLGQDIYKDYNAKRNCHYKLTLRFKNFANDVDWHIEYEEPEPGVITPEPYFISYLYNHSMMYPIKVNTGGREIEYIKAEITDNRWAPYNASGLIYYSQMDKGNANQWNGFLSLHKTVDLVIRKTTTSVNVDSNKEHYEKAPKRGERTYTDMSVGEHTTTGSDSTDTYRVEQHPTEANTYNIFIPMYTRAKQLIKETAYTGNNPYVAYHRKAEVKITTKLKGLEKTFENMVTIYQVRRIVNPKGIYRSSGKSEPFHVVLKRLPKENATEFETFVSEGPWKAYVVRHCNSDGSPVRVINLDKGSGMSECIKDTVYGKTGSEIDFNVNFDGTCDANTSRYAIIRVEYHNYTCYHLIFVRQGDSPDDLIAGGTRWHAKNMRTKTEEAESPLDEGSLFGRGNWTYPIDALNNKNPKEYWVNIVPEDFKKSYPEDGFFTIAGSGEKKKWSDITRNEDFTEPKTGWKVASASDYQALFDSDDIKQGYGVLYGDGAEETADDLNDVYGYDYTTSKIRGMRGCFVYNEQTGKNLFFPIGASGYGHRKDSRGELAENQYKGILRYASSRNTYFKPTDVSDAYPNGVNDCPLFYDIYMRPGAIYWYDKTGENKVNGTTENSVGWDFNYFTFDFYPMGSWGTSGGKDACFVRCVEK